MVKNEYIKISVVKFFDKILYRFYKEIFIKFMKNFIYLTLKLHPIGQN